MRIGELPQATTQLTGVKLTDTISEIDNNLSLLMMDFAPWLIARTAWKGREYLTQSFLRYFRTGGHRHLNASKLIYARWSTQDAAGAAFENIARMETVMGLGLLSNTIPSGFWFIFDIFSRPELQEEIRDQIIQNAVSIDSDGVHAVDMADVRDTCPLLLASFQETLRFRSNAAQFRYIYEDTMLGEYLVKGGSILVLPAAGINRSVSTWGADADTYNPRRFLDSEMSRREKASGFLSFGISPHICAGRHFATGEILALMTMLVLQFDIRPSGGEWVEPPINVKAVAASLTPPAGRMSGTFSERKGQPGAGWRFHISPGKGMHGLVIG